VLEKYCFLQNNEIFVRVKLELEASEQTVTLEAEIKQKEHEIKQKEQETLEKDT
jgi:hypothetical protein